MKYRLARSSRIALVALLPACGGGDFTTTGGNSGNHAVADAGAEASGSGGVTGNGGGTGSGGNDSSGGTGSGGRQTGDGGGSGSGGSLGTGGDGGANDDAGIGGVDAGPPGGGGTTSDGGRASGGLGGSGGSCPDPITWYVDADQDGYGSTTAPSVKSCSQPQGHYSKVGGDCHDGNREVHPQVTQQEKNFFGTPYKTSAGADSYDYDCSGLEKGDPGQTQAAMCAPLMLSGPCGGSGYQPSNRGGATANAYCGSLKFQTCKLNGLSCAATTAELTSPYRCN